MPIFQANSWQDPPLRPFLNREGCHAQGYPQKLRTPSAKGFSLLATTCYIAQTCKMISPGETGILTANERTTADQSQTGLCGTPEKQSRRVLKKAVQQGRR